MFSFRSQDKTSSAIEITISNRTVVRVLLLVVVTMLGLAAVKQAAGTLILIFSAFFLALALNSPVHWLAQRLPGKRKGSRTAATTISFVVIILLLVGFLASIVPPLVKQTNNFIHAAPQIIEDSKNADTQLGGFIRKYNLQDRVEKFSSELSGRLDEAASRAVTTVGTIGSSVFSVLTILVLTFMMLVEGPRWLRFAKEILPDHHHPRAKRIGQDMYRVVKGYVNGQVLLAALAAIFIFPVMVILGISYPVALLVVVFICGLIPLVGHTIGAIIVSTVALFTSPLAALILLGYYILYQQIENYLIQPRIQANSTNMSPLLVFTSVLIGVNFGGIFGGLVAIPVAGCIRIAALDYLRYKNIIPSDAQDNVMSTTQKKPKAK